MAIVVRVVLPNDAIEFDPLDEIQGLAETAGAIVASGMIQRREKPDNTAYLGKGKVEECDCFSLRLFKEINQYIAATYNIHARKWGVAQQIMLAEHN